MAVTWSVGAAVDKEGREKFDAFLRLLFGRRGGDRQLRGVQGF